MQPTFTETTADTADTSSYFSLRHIAKFCLIAPCGARGGWMSWHIFGRMVHNRSAIVGRDIQEFREDHG